MNYAQAIRDFLLDHPNSTTNEIWDGIKPQDRPSISTIRRFVAEANDIKLTGSSGNSKRYSLDELPPAMEPQSDTDTSFRTRPLEPTPSVNGKRPSGMPRSKWFGMSQSTRRKYGKASSKDQA